jgi:hypothetical protein
MPNKPISEEAFIAGFRHGYTNGRVAEVAHSDIEGNAEAAYRIWSQERQKVQPPAAFGAVIPVTGVKVAEKKE